MKCLFIPGGLAVLELDVEGLITERRDVVRSKEKFIFGFGFSSGNGADGGRDLDELDEQFFAGRVENASRFGGHREANVSV